MTELIRAWRAARRPPTPANIAAVMELYPVGERFFQELTLRQVLLNAAKNGQLRLAPSAQVIGIDMDAALTLAAARGHDVAVLSELLPAAEAGLVAALPVEVDQLH
jgi:hypothetical protein